GHQYGNVDPGIFVLIDVVAVAGRRDDLQVERRSDSCVEHKVAVAGDLHVRFELVLGEVLEAARRGMGMPVAKDALEEPFEKPHVSDSDRKLSPWIVEANLARISDGRANGGHFTSEIRVPPES